VAQLNPERWRALSPYLDEVLAMPEDLRPAWVATVSARDAALGADLESLLAEHASLQDSDFLARAVPLDHPQHTSLMEGQVLGSYRLISLIGQGGMGSVWLAERCDGRFEGRVAVKLLNVALAGQIGEERFRREGTFLAKVTHSHIARLIDAGVAPSGQPYLVLEHVDGRPIDQYCFDRSLGIEARLALFLDVLAAVAHAHANLIVHRDLKPANVLVDANGDVKLLDFGIAKLVGDDERVNEDVERNGLTREAGAAFTPLYAAPEQLVQGQVTTATDVYALGVLLFVLLTGRHPVGAAAQSPHTLVRAIVENEPPRMVDVVIDNGSQPSGDLALHADHCGTSVGKLRRVLGGDLDTIVAKALKKNPSERYASVTAMADDVRRFLRHEPISARADTLGYRAARFLRRHLRAVAAAAAVVLGISALTAFYTARVTAERDRAQREAIRAARVSEALTGLLRGADPIANRATSDTFTVTGLLDSATVRVQQELANEPEAQAEIFTIIGRMYRRIGLYDKAQQLLGQALASGRTAFGPEHVNVAQTLTDLGALAAEKGDYATAAASLESALSMRRRLHGPDHREVADTLAELGRLYQDQGFNDRAEPLHREALAIRRKTVGADSGETAVSLSDLASVLRLAGNLHEAETLLRQSLDLNRRTRGETHAMTATTLHDLALIEAVKGERAVAETMFRQAMDTHRKALAENHPLVAVGLNSLSRVLREQGRLAEAAAALEEALGIARPALGSNHQLIAIYTLNLASVELARGHREVAGRLAREGLRIRLLSPTMVPNRRRIYADDEWSPEAIQAFIAKTGTIVEEER
jgi:serine/threonine-protein kinase